MSQTATEQQTVLLVEDNPSESELIKRRIEGYHDAIDCTVASSVDEALDVLNQSPDAKDDENRLPNLVLLDIFLRGQNGFYLLEELKSDPFLSKIPVVILTGSQNEDEIERSYRFGANAFVSKPDSIETFNRMIGSLVNFWLKNARTPPSDGGGRVREFHPPKKPDRGEQGDELSVLLVEDNPADQRTIERYLSESAQYSFDIESVRTTEKARDRLRNENVDLILLDYMLPEQTGMSFMGSLKGTQPEPPLPVIMLSGQGDEELASESIRAGAMEYIAKEELSESMLQNSINRVLERFQKIRAGHDWERQLTPASLTEPVTGLLNWQFFMHRLDEEINRANRYENYFSLLALRIEELKTMKKDYDAPVVKDYLKTVSNLLTDNLRVSDIIARNEDDTFWIISPGTRAHEARLFAIRLSQQFESGIAVTNRELEFSSPLYGGIQSIGSTMEQTKSVMNSHLLVERTRSALERAREEEMMNILSVEAS